MSHLFDWLKGKVQGKGIRIVFPEGNDERIVEAAKRLAQEGVLRPILLGENIGAIDGIETIRPSTSSLIQEMLPLFVERRKGKVSVEDAHHLLKDANYFGTMLVEMGLAEGLVSGAAHSTADTVRPALQIIKTKPGVKKISGVFIMTRQEQTIVLADCAINVNPSKEDLAEIALESAKTAERFGITPKVAMLSFSSHGSAVTEESLKVAEATLLAKKMAPDLIIDGELQFDAAIVPSVAKQKVPNSVLVGAANVFVFPTLDAGNIGYKITERLGGFEAVGPILQGVNKPVNDLSRGCTAEDIYHLAIVTANQV